MHPRTNWGWKRQTGILSLINDIFGAVLFWNVAVRNYRKNYAHRRNDSNMSERPHLHFAQNGNINEDIFFKLPSGAFSTSTKT